MARYAVVDTSTNTVVNTIEADETFDVSPFIKIQSDTAEIGWVYDPIEMTVSPPPPTLQQQLEWCTMTKLEEGYTLGSFQFTMGDLASLAADYAQVSTALGVSGSRIVAVGIEQAVALTGPQIIEVFDGLLALRAGVYYARSQVQEDINNSVITDWEEVQDAFDTAFLAAPVLTITRITDELTTVGTALTSLDTRVTTLENA